MPELQSLQQAKSTLISLFYYDIEAMHKTNVLLEDWQYETLRSLAAQEQRSISALVREVLTRYLARDPETAQQRLATIEGIGADSQAAGREHDNFLYTTDRQP